MFIVCTCVYMCMYVWVCYILFTLNTDVTAEQPSSSDAKKAKIKDTVNISTGMSCLTVLYTV